MGKNTSGTWCGIMTFEREFYKEEFEKLLALSAETKFFIKESNASFKIKRFVKKGIDSLVILAVL